MLWHPSHPRLSPSRRCQATFAESFTGSRPKTSDLRQVKEDTINILLAGSENKKKCSSLLWAGPRVEGQEGKERGWGPQRTSEIKASLANKRPATEEEEKSSIRAGRSTISPTLTTESRTSSSCCCCCCRNNESDNNNYDNNMKKISEKTPKTG